MNDALYSRFDWIIISSRGHHVELTKSSLTIAPPLARSFLSCLIPIYFTSASLCVECFGELSAPQLTLCTQFAVVSFQKLTTS
jgi:hypothetical protein